VRRPDVEHDADPGRRERGQVADVADVPGAHLQHQVAGGLVGAQDGQRQPDLGVEGSWRGHSGAMPGEDLGQDVLGGGLAGRAGQRDDGDVLDPGQGVPGELAEGGGDVGHDDGRAADGPGGEHAGRPGGEGLGGEVVAVDAGSGDGGEHSAGHHLAGVAGRRAGHARVRVRDIGEGPAGDGGDLGQAEHDHGQAPSVAGVSSGAKVMQRPV
jgi:hypothetical protein